MARDLTPVDKSSKLTRSDSQRPIMELIARERELNRVVAEKKSQHDKSNALSNYSHPKSKVVEKIVKTAIDSSKQTIALFKIIELIKDILVFGQEYHDEIELHKALFDRDVAQKEREDAVSKFIDSQNKVDWNAPGRDPYASKDEIMHS